MKRALTAATFGASLCTAAFGQALSYHPSADASSGTTAIAGPVAYVYVSARIGNTKRTEIQAFAAAPDGRLAAVPGSPFPADVTFMAVNGLYLFGSNTTGTYISAFAITPDGGLRYAASSDVVQPDTGACDSPGALVFDHTGATLYNVDYFATSCANAAYEGFTVQKPSGRLALVNEAGVGVSGAILSFTGDNHFAYGADCVQSSPRIYGYQRDGNGSLTQLSLNPAFPAPPASEAWCPEMVAADTTNHLAIPLYLSPGYPDRSGPDQLATYTVQSNGTITTSSTYTNMPKVAVGYLTNIDMAPSGKLLAVAGVNGLQIFHFNGADPMTAYTGPILRQEVDQIFWDNANHLYAVGQSAGKLWVFTVSPTGYSQAPGSPYSINDPQNVVVQPWPLPWSTSEARKVAPAVRGRTAHGDPVLASIE
jgi:hypothetical protein